MGKTRSLINALSIPVFILSLASCTMMKETMMPESGDSDQYVDDTSLAAKIRQALNTDEHVRTLQINVRADDGEVELSGFVDSPETEKKAVHLAEQVRGVRLVKDSMVVAKDSVIVAPTSATPGAKPQR